MATAISALEKPRLRGVSHHVAFFIALLAGAILVVVSPSAKHAVIATIYAVSLAAMFGVSALYHRPAWRAPQRALMRRLDHSTIFLLIAGTHTPLCVFGVREPRATTLLVVVWAGAALGIALKLLWPTTPRWLSAAIYVALGWVAVGSVPYALPSIGFPGGALLAAGGAAYSLGALVYALKRPDPLPKVFGYHEVFHLLVIVASALHYVAVARVILW